MLILPLESRSKLVLVFQIILYTNLLGPIYMFDIILETSMHQNSITVNCNPIYPVNHNFGFPLQTDHQMRPVEHHSQQMNFFLTDRIGTHPNPNVHHMSVKQEPNSHKHSTSLQIAGQSDNEKIIVEKKMAEVKRIEHFSYLTSDEIGIGFSSRVYKGKNDQTNEQVAIKVIDLKKANDDLNNQFINEQIGVLEKIRSINPENLLKLEGVFRTKNNIYIISEFCEGKDMGKVLRKKQKLTQEEAQSVMKQLLNGYEELSKLNIVHRDLKLANIFVKKGKIKIADFGFALDADKCNFKFDYNVGSPYYMPPQSLKFNRYSFKSDVWAIGVIAYELVHGKLPWKDKHDSVLFDKITSVPIEELIDSELKLSENYYNFIRRCLTVDYERRVSPALVVNWPWNMAKSFVEGIEEKKRPFLQHHHSLNLNYGSMEEIPGEIGIFKKKTVINSHVSLEEHKTKFIKSLIDADNKNSKGEGSPFSIEQTIVAQLHYCRFLSNLYQQINPGINKFMGPPKLVKHGSLMNPQQEIPNLDQTLEVIKSSIAERIVNKMQIVSEIARTNQNLLKISGFENFVKTPAWEKLKGVIGQYQSKYLQEYKQKINPFIKNTNGLSPEAIESLLISNIKALKGTLNNHTKNLRLLEILTFYYQVLGLQKKNNPSNFAHVGKMDLMGSKKQHQSVAIQRLVKKLEYMGL